jgi:hypothetical protein
LLLILFGGVTDRLIPLFAVGAFMAFTLSQAGMVGHWWRTAKGVAAWRGMLVNGLGALATGITVMVIVVAKFAEGAWVVVLPDLCTEFGLVGDCLLNFGPPRFFQIGFGTSAEDLPL